MKRLMMALMLMLAAVTAHAAELQTVRLEVDKMTCNLCPLTVRTALQQVDGVEQVTARYEGDGVGWAEVTFDPDKASIEDLTLATGMAGYPSRLKP